MPTIAQSKEKGSIKPAFSKLTEADEIRRMLIYRFGCQPTQPVNIKNQFPLLAAKRIVGPIHQVTTMLHWKG